MPTKDNEHLLDRIRELQGRLEEAEETLRAIRGGEVDAIVGSGPEGDRIFTLKGADEAYRVLVQDMAEGALTLTREGLILFSNQQFAALAGLPLDRVIGSRVQEFVVPEDFGTLSAILAGDGIKAEVHLKSESAKTKPVYLSVSSLEVDGLECISLVATDLTEQKRSKEIVASEKLARSILEQAAGTILVVDPDGKIIRASRAAEQLAGASVLLRKFDDVFPLRAGSAGEALTFKEIISQVRRSGNIAGLQATAGMMDGRALDVLVNAALLSNPDNQLLGCIIGFSDITEIKRIEAALRESESRERGRAAELQAVLEAVPAAVLVTHDRDARLMTSNRTGLEMMGLPPGSNVSMTAPESERKAKFRWLRRGKDIPSEDMPVQFAARTGQPVHGSEIELMLEDGTRRHWLGHVEPLLDDAGQPQGAVGAYLDISDRNRMEERLREAAKLESIGMLAGGIAHDFNNLLVGVIGNASLAREMLPPRNEVDELLDRIIRTGEQAAHLTRQMLAYAGKGRIQAEAIDLSEIVQAISPLVQPSISKRIALQLDLKPDLPAVEADPGQVQQVFTNLALNAAESIGSSAGLISVKTGVQEVDEDSIRRDPESAELEHGTYVSLEVRDTGSGMDDSTKAKIFEPFFTTKFLGRGLGLAAVAGIVRSHKGAIRVTSAPGEGSCFTVLLPASKTGAAPATSQRPRRKTLHGTGTILVVDDEPVVRDMAKNALEQYGFKVLLADGGLAAIDIFKREPREISLVLLDLSMPVMGGADVLPELRRIRPDVKVVISSGYSEAETLRFFQGLPISGFIQKPYTVTGLVEALERALA